MNVVVEHGVTNISSKAFTECNNMKTVTLPDTVTQIDYLAFKSCTLESINLPDSLTYLAGSAFWGCTKLKSISIPACITSIGEKTFLSCRLWPALPCRMA